MSVRYEPVLLDPYWWVLVYRVRSIQNTGCLLDYRHCVNRRPKSTSRSREYDNDMAIQAVYR
jgi:hypothetical protein